MDGAASFGQWLERRRKARDITQQELADLVGYAKSTIHMIECGERRPSRQLIALLVGYSAVAEDEREAFLRWAREPHPNEQILPSGVETGITPESTVGAIISTPTPSNLRQEPTRINRTLSRRG